jgi:4-hydroxybenzoyl-CoA thioesterase/acyl-CoA thioester hydrolase
MLVTPVLASECLWSEIVTVSLRELSRLAERDCYATISLCETSPEIATKGIVEQMPSEFRTSRRVEWADTDAAGIIHFSRYFCFMEEVEHEFLRSLGLSCMMQRDGICITWPRVSASCEFIRPVRFEDVMDVHLIVRRKGTKSITFALDFSHNGTAVARGQVVTACCRIEQDHLVSIPIPDFVHSLLHEHPTAVE